MSGGDISSLAAKCSCPKAHSYDKPVAGFTVYYGRDRKEIGTEAQVINSVSEIDGQEYDYVFKDGSWYLLEDGEKFVPLDEVLSKRKKD